MKTQDINIRDPFVLLHEDTYYLYGTRSSTCWSEADGFDCYTSGDLAEWNGPFEVFHRPEGFFAHRNYWAPECYFHEGKFYLLTTFGAEDRKKGVYVLTADAPVGPFVPVGDTPLTPADWTCIDGSLYWDENSTPWLIFSHSFEDTPDGDMCAVALSRDLTRCVSEPVVLFSAKDAPWATPIPFAKAEFNMDGDVYFTDGPCVHKMDNGALAMLWSSWSKGGYAVGTALSPSGNLCGPWEHLEVPLFPENGGHGMLFRDKTGQLLYTLHFPNDKLCEHPIFEAVAEKDGALQLVNC